MAKSTWDRFEDSDYAKRVRAKLEQEKTAMKAETDMEIGKSTLFNGCVDRNGKPVTGPGDKKNYIFEGIEDVSDAMERLVAKEPTGKFEVAKNKRKIKRAADEVLMDDECPGCDDPLCSCSEEDMEGGDESESDSLELSSLPDESEPEVDVDTLLEDISKTLEAKYKAQKLQKKAKSKVVKMAKKDLLNELVKIASELDEIGAVEDAAVIDEFLAEEVKTL